MPKYKVLLQQYVEEVAEVEVEADTIEEARAIALSEGCDADWSEGDDAYAVDVYAVMDENNELVWER